MKKGSIIEFCAALSCGLLAAALFWGWKSHRAETVADELATYTLIEDGGYGFTGTVTHLESSTATFKGTLIELSDGSKLCTKAPIIYYGYEKKPDWVYVGDVISKAPNSDTVYVVRSDTSFYFVLGIY